MITAQKSQTARQTSDSIPQNEPRAGCYSRTTDTWCATNSRPGKTWERAWWVQCVTAVQEYVKRFGWRNLFERMSLPLWHTKCCRICCILQRLNVAELNVADLLIHHWWILLPFLCTYSLLTSQSFHPLLSSLILPLLLHIFAFPQVLSLCCHFQEDLTLTLPPLP